MRRTFARRVELSSTAEICEVHVRGRCAFDPRTVRKGDFAKGLARSREALELSPLSVAALEVASMASVGLGDRDLAKAYVDKILAIDSDNPTALTLRQTLESADKVFRSLSEATDAAVAPTQAQ